MTLRPVFWFLATLSFIGAFFLWQSTPPSAASIFDSQKTKQLEGSAAPYRTPKGVTQVRLTTATGASFFTDCLAIPIICSGQNEASQSILVQAVFIHGQVFWPTSVQANGKVVVDAKSSAQAYQLFVEREGELYRFPLLLGVAFMVFSSWFGHRPALP